MRLAATNLVFALFLERRQIILWRQLAGFAGAELAQKILFGFECSSGKLTLMTMIANLVRTAMAAIAIDDSRVALANASELKVSPKRHHKRHRNAI